MFWGQFLISLTLAIGATQDFEAEIAKRANLPEIDEKSLASAQVQCREDSKALIGNLPCKDSNGQKGFINEVLDSLKPTLAAIVRGSKSGFSVDWQGRSKYQGANACNLLQGEGLDPSDNAKNSEGKPCGKWCDIKVSTGVTGVDVTVSDKGGGVCRREYGYFYGVQLQALNKMKQQVVAEFRAKNLQLVDFDGVRPCAGPARDALRLQIGTNNAIEDWIKKYGRSQVEGMSCVEMDAQAMSDHIGECSMKVANKSVVALWSSLLACEISMRTQKFMITKSLDEQKWFEDAKKTVGDTCEKQVCLVCTDAERTRQANDCYHKEAPKYVQGKMRELGLETPGDSL